MQRGATGDASNAHVGPTSGEPPHNVDAEQAVLGACMLNHQAVEKVRGTLDAGDFYRPAHETIWRAILALRAEEAPTDPIALTDHLQRAGDLSRVGGSSYLHTLVAAAPPSTDNADYYAQIVRLALRPSAGRWADRRAWVPRARRRHAHAAYPKRSARCQRAILCRSFQ
ncbi:hypothetical protein DR950_24050 [Kitasatospora xanthocidica]|uniref:DNA helicase DnaB-like N-terminal domain-containing protein n=1 Tax=Kitasatospora xanthocidica TaxID=83382 RepID=A0A372ZZ17_9ACTN|nr:DnaB-like helicase N-terminal domain-containing protein [Kitasatospora xanthocidica]RGD60445.1 hypothetical protein DR950_24050 [Kitasatospora xanthocidica]